VANAARFTAPSPKINSNRVDSSLHGTRSPLSETPRSPPSETPAQPAARITAPDFEDPAPLLVLFGMSLVKHDAVARLDHGDGRIVAAVRLAEVCFIQFDQHAAAGAADERADAYPAALGKAAEDQPLVVDPFEKAGRETARETLRQVLLLPRRQCEWPRSQRRVEGCAVGLRRHGHVLGALQPPLDLQARHAQPSQLADQVVGRQVLRAEKIGVVAQVAPPAVDDQLVGHAAGLGALAPVGAASTQGLARQALAAVRHTQRAVNEHFHRQRRAFRHTRSMSAKRQLAGQDHPLDAK